MEQRITTPFTNEHFAAFCLSMVGQPYWYGTCLYKCTESLRSSKSNQYPSHYGSSRPLFHFPRAILSLLFHSPGQGS